MDTEKTQQNDFIDALKAAIQPLMELQQTTIDIQLLNARYSREEIRDVLLKVAQYNDDLKRYEKSKTELFERTQQNLSVDEAIDVRQNYANAEKVTEELRKKIDGIKKEYPLIFKLLKHGLV